MATTDITKIELPNGDFANLKDNAATENIGALNNLTTENKSNLVNAINEINSYRKVVQTEKTVNFTYGYTTVDKPGTDYILINVAEKNSHGATYLYSDYDSSKSLIYLIAFSGSAVTLNTGNVQKDLTLIWSKP